MTIVRGPRSLLALIGWRSVIPAMLKQWGKVSANFGFNMAPAIGSILQRGAAVIVLLCGGDKSTQTKDIKLAKALEANLED